MKVYCGNCKYKKESIIFCRSKYFINYNSNYNKYSDCKYYKPKLIQRIKELIELIFPVYEPLKVKKRG